MNEQELVKYFESRRGDTSTWSREPVEASVRRGGGVVFSLRLPPAELEELRQRAEQQGQTVSDLIRSALPYALAERPRVSVQNIVEFYALPADAMPRLIELGIRSRGSEARDLRCSLAGEFRQTSSQTTAGV